MREEREEERRRWRGEEEDLLLFKVLVPEFLYPCLLIGLQTKGIHTQE